MRVLVYTPVVKGKYYKLHYDALYSLEPLESGGQIDYLQLVGGDTAEHPFDNITRKMNEARWLALQGDYDAILMVESDVIVPPETLKKLAAVEASVAYGLVVHTHGWPTWNASVELNDKMAVPISLFPDQARAAWGNVVEVAGVGSSCVLIHWDVLDRVKFWRKDTPEFQRSCDWYFSEDCVKEGIEQKCDTTVICGHIELDLMPRVLWPSIEHKGFYRSDVIGELPWDIQTNELEYAEDTPNVRVRALQPLEVGEDWIVEGELFYTTPIEARRLQSEGKAEMILTRHPKRLEQEAIEQEPGWFPKKPCEDCPEKEINNAISEDSL
ncbi:MAG: hypothetical protein WBB22_12515 [Anaerolineae bacterium]